MSFMNFFRNLFGLPPDGNRNNNRQDENVFRDPPNEFRKPIWNMDDYDDDDDDFRAPHGHHFGFRIDSDPFEIHRFFEQQMDEMMKRFQSFGFGPSGPGMFSIEPPSLEDTPHGSLEERHRPSGSLRDECLKPGYETHDRNVGMPKRDSDLDDRLIVEDLDKILQRKPRSEDYAPEANRSLFPGFSTQSFGQFVSTKIIRTSNGGTEQHRTVRDNKGNEETTITRTLGDQTYTVIVKTDASGQKEKIENFVNIDEGKLDDFKKRWGSKL